MKTHLPNGQAQRAGALLGKAWLGTVRGETQFIAWLVEHGLPATTATALLWIVKLVVLGILLYAAFWLALILVFVIAVAWATRHADWEGDDQQPEWREGHSGYGLYDNNEWQRDMGDPDEP